MCIMVVQNANQLNDENDLLILHGSTRVLQSHSFWEEAFPPPALGPPAAPQSLFCALHHQLHSLPLGCGAAPVQCGDAGASRSTTQLWNLLKAELPPTTHTPVHHSFLRKQRSWLLELVESGDHFYGSSKLQRREKVL